MSIKHCVIRILMGLLTALTLVASCDKIDNERQDEPADNEFVLAEEVILIEESDAGLIVSCGENDIVMSPSDKYDFSGGRILCCPVTEATPHGFAGRIVEVGRDGDLLTLRTEPVGLEDVFAELHVDGVYDMAETIEQSLDSEGSTIVPETVSDTVWNWLSEIHADSLSLGILNTRSTKPATKAMVGVSVPVTISLPVECGGFKGSVYVKCSMGVSINISRRLKIRKFDITVNRQTGVEGRWTLLEQGLELKKELFSLEHRMRPVLIPGTPIAIVPSLYTRMGLEASAESKISASMRYQFENTTYTYSYGGGVPSFDGRNLLSDGDRYFRFAEFSTDGQVSASFVAGGKLSLWNEKVLAVGSEAGAGVSFEAEAAVSMDDDGLLVSNPEVSIQPSLGLSLYCESLLFKALPGSDGGRFFKTRTFDIPGLSMSVFPKNESVKADIDNGGVETGTVVPVESEMSPSSLLRCSETGFALFGGSSDVKPVEHRKVAVSDVDGAAADRKVSCEFAVPKGITPVMVRPYVVHDGRYWYGTPVRLDGRLISKIEIYCAQDGYSAKYHISYDSQGRVEAINCSEREGSDSPMQTSIAHYDYDYGYVRGGLEGTEWYKFVGDRIVSSYKGENMVEYSYSGGSDRPVGASCGNGYSYVWNWADDNITKFSINEYGDEDVHVEYEYSNIENRMNIDIYDLWEERYDGISFFDRGVFSILTCRNLLKGSNENHSYSYTFDENGDVKNMSVRAGDEIYSVSIFYY